MFHPKDKVTIEDKAQGWVISEEDNPKAYGSYSGLDVEAIDLHKHKKWNDIEWFDAQMETGDCLFVPRCPSPPTPTSHLLSPLTNHPPFGAYHHRVHNYKHAILPYCNSVQPASEIYYLV